MSWLQGCNRPSTNSKKSCRQAAYQASHVCVHAAGLRPVPTSGSHTLSAASPSYCHLGLLHLPPIDWHVLIPAFRAPPLRDGGHFPAILFVEHVNYESPVCVRLFATRTKASPEKLLEPKRFQLQRGCHVGAFQHDTPIAIRKSSWPHACFGSGKLKPKRHSARRKGPL